MNLDTNDLPDTITLKIVACVTRFGWIKFFEEGDIPNPDDNVLISEAPIRVRFNIKKQVEVTADLVSSLKAEKALIRADAEKQCNMIEDKIQSMLALPDLKAVK